MSNDKAPPNPSPRPPGKPSTILKESAHRPRQKTQRPPGKPNTLLKKGIG